MGNKKRNSNETAKEVTIAKFGMTQAIIVAALGLIGTVLAAFFASPVLTTWIKPSATATLQLNLPIINLAPTSSVQVSSVTPGLNDPVECQAGYKAIDGVVAGYPEKDCNEWASDHEGAGAWIRLTFPKQVNISTIILYDRPNPNDHVMSGELEFSDGTIIRTNILPNDGAALSIPVKLSNSVQWVKFSISSVSSETNSIGLAEIEVMGSFVP